MTIKSILVRFQGIILVLDYFNRQLVGKTTLFMQDSQAVGFIENKQVLLRLQSPISNNYSIFELDSE